MVLLLFLFLFRSSVEYRLKVLIYLSVTNCFTEKGLVFFWHYLRLVFRYITLEV